MKLLLFTGASGFLGLNILSALKKEYFVDTLSTSKIANYRINLAEQVPVFNKEYDIILHAAGKAHTIPKIERDIKEFYAINYQGTKNLCTGFENSGLPQSFVFISSVAVYGCESGEHITEDYPLNAKTPYGMSKIQAEEYLLEWCYRKKINLIILRPSLLAGKNPSGNLGEMIKSISQGRYFSIANGRARKSMAMVDDISRLVSYCEGKSGIFNLCDSYNPTFKELEEVISKQLNRPAPLNIPMWSAKLLANIGDLFTSFPINTKKLKKITQSLTFSNEKIQKILKFSPNDVLTHFSIR
jgi:nucleoside-diphosphate-sugar epimerase